MMAARRALVRYLGLRRTGAARWDKTAHAFPRQPPRRMSARPAPLPGPRRRPAGSRCAPPCSRRAGGRAAAAPSPPGAAGPAPRGFARHRAARHTAAPGAAGRRDTPAFSYPGEGPRPDIRARRDRRRRPPAAPHPVFRRGAARDRCGEAPACARREPVARPRARRRPAATAGPVSAWMLLRDERGRPALAPGGTLGGSQAGARLALPDRRRPGAERARLSRRCGGRRAPRRRRGSTGGPSARAPVHLLAERRQAARRARAARPSR